MLPGSKFIGSPLENMLEYIYLRINKLRDDDQNIPWRCKVCI
jgi:hypothetical protein